MTRGFPSIGFLGRFGRSEDLKRLDAALRACDLHPQLVPEPVKLTLVKLLREDRVGATVRANDDAAALLAYCMTGPEMFARANGEAALADAEARIEAAIAAGDTLDARIVLLALHAGLLQPAIRDRYGLESG